MSKRILTLQNLSAETVKEMRAIVDKAAAEERQLTDDEKKRFSELETKHAGLKEEIERETRLLAIEVDGAQIASTEARDIRPQPAERIDMPEKEARKYSFLRAILALTDRDFSLAGLEYEASKAVEKRAGRPPRGLYVPLDVLETRDIQKDTSGATGGYLIGTDHLAASFIDRLKARMMVRAAGARVLSGLVGDIAIPKLSTGHTAYWIDEATAITESTPALAQVTLAPKTVGAFSDFSRKLLLQSSPDVEGIVRDDIIATISLAVDLAALHGSGASNQPTGIASTAGIGSVAGGTNGATPSWDNIVALESEVAVDNADLGALAYMTNAKVRGELKTVEKASNTGLFCWNDNAPTSPLNGYPAFTTNQVASDLDKGTSTGVCSAIFFGNWNDLLIGLWGGLDLYVDRSVGATTGATRVYGYQDVDIAVRHAESFAAMLDALTTI